MKKPLVFLSVLILFFGMLGSANSTIHLSIELNNLTGTYNTLEEIIDSGGNYLGKEQIVDFGVPVFPVRSFTFEIWGTVTFPLYEDTDGNINPGTIPGNFRMADGDFGSGLIDAGAPLKLQSYSSGITGYTNTYILNGNQFYLNKTFTYEYFNSPLIDYFLEPSFRGDGWYGLVFTYLDAGATGLEPYQVGSINVTRARLTVSAFPEQVSIDIIPKTCPNERPIKGGGSVEVAILGTADFDVNDIDIASVRLEGVAPTRSGFKDKSSPVISPSDVCYCTTDRRDGFLDLCLKFDKKAIITAIETELGGVVELDTEYPLTLSGNLKDGTPIEGQDCVVFVKKGKKD